MPTNPRTVRIDGSPWFDLGSDVDWETYGGTWGRPMPTEDEPDRWAVIRLDTDPDQDCDPVAVAVHVRISEIPDDCLFVCDVPLDGQDAYGREIPFYDGWKVYAYIATWGCQGPAGGDAYSDKRASVARARAARELSREYEIIEARRAAVKHAESCRKCIAPIIDEEGNPGDFGEACKNAGLKLLVRYCQLTNTFVPSWASARLERKA